MTRPYITINCAMSADGKIALPTRKQTAISGEEDMRRVHQLRANVDAICVGIGTVLSDDPSLTVKEKIVPGAQNPLRVVLDSSGKTPRNARVLDGHAPTLIAVSGRYKKGRFSNAEVAICGKRSVELPLLMRELEKRGVKWLLVEGGGRVIWSFLSEGFFDELSIFIGSVAIGGGPSPADGGKIKSLEEAVKLRLRVAEKIDDGILLKYVPA